MESKILEGASYKIALNRKGIKHTVGEIRTTQFNITIFRIEKKQ